MKVAKLSLFKPVGILAFFKDGCIQTTWDKKVRRGMLPYRTGYIFPTNARIFAHL